MAHPGRMGHHVSVTKSVAMAVAKGSLSELASRAAAGERFLLLRRGKPVAALVGPADLDVLRAAAKAETFVAALEAFRRRHRASLPREPLVVKRSAPRRVG